MTSGLNMLLWCHLLILCLFCSAANIIRPGEILKDGDNITSPQGKFILGFFSPPDSTKKFLGIWNADVPEQMVVWVANRNKPGSEQNCVFIIEKDGNLVVRDYENGNLLWSSNSSATIKNSTAVLLDTGNLVVTGNNNKVLWESFQNPTDTFLPQMNILMNLHSGERRIFSSWTSKNDPSPGRYSFGFDPRGSPQIVIWDGPIRRWRSGYWDGQSFTGIPDMKVSYLYGFRLYLEEDRLYFTYVPENVSDFVRYKIIWTGYEVQQKWDKRDGQWKPIQYLPSGGCDLYNLCGNFARCDVSNSQQCLCLEGFVPSDFEEWKAANRTGGCVRETELECKANRDAFMTIERIKLPDFADIADALNINECKSKCLENCSCTAYAHVMGINCMIWHEELVDLQQFKEGGKTLYVRVARSESGKKSRAIKIVKISVLVAGTFVVSIAVWLLWKYKAKRRLSNRMEEMPIVDPIWSENLGVEGQKLSGSELTFFSFSRVAAATNNFSNLNKLGQGGFGPVFRGKLQSGEEIAVKRLSRKSGQGFEEFKNEIMLIAKLQHRNLVRLLGCCIEGEEKMLLYDYMPNKSLDSFLFDPVKQAQLNWTKRFNIIEGIARGLLYLHRDSRLRIIHRDLKASNILLDEEMNPKISDFGMARIFGGNQNEANTDRVVGTYGYMAPEYAMEGLFSGKSDVYSFGVLLLEIICGRRNTGFCTADNSGIIDYAWEKWDEGTPMDVLDHSIWGECQHDEVLRCIHIALLCVQDLAIHRPDMYSVVLMLENENIRLDSPRQPTLTSLRRSEDAIFWNQNEDLSSDKVSVSVTVGR